MDVFLTSFSGAERGRKEASVSHAGFPGETAAPAPDAAHPWAGLHAALLCQKGLAAGGPVNKHIVEQHTGEAPKHVHGPGGDKQSFYSKRQNKEKNIHNLIKFFRMGQKITQQKVKHPVC